MATQNQEWKMENVIESRRGNINNNIKQQWIYGQKKKAHEERQADWARDGYRYVDETKPQR